MTTVDSFSNFIQLNGSFILTFMAVLTGCTSGLFVYVLKSRCSNIKCCWGLLSCIREPIPATDLDNIQITTTSHLADSTNL